MHNDLAGGGSVTVAVSVSDKCKVLGDKRNCDKSHVTRGRRHFFFLFYFSPFLSVLVLVLLSAHVERFNVSCMLFL